MENQIQAVPVEAPASVEAEIRLVTRCQDHPTYTGRRKPRLACPTCHFIYDRERAKALAPAGGAT